MKTLITFFGYAVLVYFCAIAGLFFAQRDIMYVPSYDRPQVKNMGIIGLEEINVQAADGLKLYGWYKPALYKNKPVVVWFHGNAGNVADSTINAMPFIKAGYGLLLPEYRGYSQNPGSPSENGLYNDARAFWSWLVKQGINPKNVILVGESLGGGVAMQLAYENPTIHTLVLIAPFTNARDIAKMRYPFMPVDMLLKDRYENIEKIKSVRSPILIVHGDQDVVVPLENGQALYDAAPKPKSFIVIQDAGHNNVYEHGAVEKILNLLSE